MEYINFVLSWIADQFTLTALIPTVKKKKKKNNHKINEQISLNYPNLEVSDLCFICFTFKKN